MIIRALIAIVVFLVLIWSAFWFTFNNIHQQVIDNIISDLQKQDIKADYSEMNVKGFPNRFDTTILQPTYSDPANNLSWHAEFLQVLALSYQPYRIIIAWPENQTIKLNDQIITIEAENLRASLSLWDMHKPKINKFIAESKTIGVTSSFNWRLRFSDPLLAMRRNGTNGEKIEISLRLEHLLNSFEAPADSWLKAIANDLNSLEIGLTLEFDDQYTREQCRNGAIKLVSAQISKGRLRWKESQLDVRGTLTIFDGRLSGDLLVDVGEAGFSTLLAKMPMNKVENPEIMDKIQNVVSVIDTISRGSIEIQFDDGELKFMGFPLVILPNIELCS